MIRPLFEMFRDAMMANANDSRKKQLDAFIASVKSDPSCLEALATDYFERMAAVHYVRVENPDSKAFLRTSVSQDKVERMSKPLPAPVAMVRRNREETTARTSAVFESMKSKVLGVLLLDLVLPTGKTLRESTGRECIKAGGFFEAVGKSLKPTQVVDKHLTENDLQNIKARFYQANQIA